MRGGRRGGRSQSQGRDRGLERRGLECKGFALLRDAFVYLFEGMTRSKLLESRSLRVEGEQRVQHELGFQPRRLA